MEHDDKIYAAIDTERKERRVDIAEINKRLDQVLDAIRTIAIPQGLRQSNGNGHSNGKSVAVVFATVILSVGSILQIQLGNESRRITLLQSRIHDADIRGNSDMLDRGEMREKFVGVETQFGNLDERTHRMEIKFDSEVKDVENMFERRIDRLESKVNQFSQGGQGGHL